MSCPRTLLQLTSVIALRAFGQAQATPPDTGGTACFENGTAYSDPLITIMVPNGAYLESARLCQEECMKLRSCEYFTYHEHSTPPGACWLLGVNATWTLDKIAVSGPKACSNEAKSTSWVDNASRPFEPLKDGFPWWGWFLVGLVLIVAGLIVMFVFWGRRGSTEKQEKARRRGMKTMPDVLESCSSAEASPALSLPLPAFNSAASYSALPTTDGHLTGAQASPLESAGPSQPSRLSFMPQDSVNPSYQPHGSLLGPRASLPGQFMSAQSFGSLPLASQQAVAPQYQRQSFNH